MHIFSYVITHDDGFAPNPFCGFLTLATCKPKIRRYARNGDYIVGTGSTKTVGNHRLVYAARIEDVISIEEYGALQKYAEKRPSMRGGWQGLYGDNVYFKVKGHWKQRRNPHHGIGNMAKDLSGKYVLMCRRFWYFGEDAIPIPQGLHAIIKKMQGHKRIKDEFLVQQFVRWISAKPIGLHGKPEMKLSVKSGCDDAGSRCSIC